MPAGPVSLIAVAGSDSTVRVRMPAAIVVDAGPPALPRLVVTHATLGDVTVTLSPVHADVAVTAVATGRRQLTASAAVASVAGLPGPDGEAYLLSAGAGAMQCRVIGVDQADATKVLLASPLTRVPSVSVGSPGTLQFSTFTGTVAGGAGQLGETAGDLRYVLHYRERTGADAAAVDRQLEGLLRIESPPWPGTGLDTPRLYDNFPELAVAVPPGQVDWAPQIRAGLRDLQGRLGQCRPDLGIGEAVIGGDRLCDAHAYFTAAIYYQRQDLERAAELRAYGQELLERECHNLDTLVSGAVVPPAARSYPGVGIGYATTTEAEDFSWSEDDSGAR